MTKRKPNLDARMTKAGPVTIKQADGTVKVQPAHTVNDDGTRVVVPREVAHKVWKRDGNRCRYCGTTDGPFRLDPIRPGKATQKNVVVACVPCIITKGGRYWAPRVRPKYRA
jgi:hypothetical protein